VTPLSIDHIQVTDQLIDINYWVGNEKTSQSVLFRVTEFEHWLSNVRKISWDSYWENWQPKTPNTYNHRIVTDDIQRFFDYKMGVTAPQQQPLLSDLKRPMHKVTSELKTSTSNKKSRSA
jgi:hypothetical protein